MALTLISLYKISSIHNLAPASHVLMPLSRKDLKCTGDDYVTILHLSDLHFVSATITETTALIDPQKKVDAPAAAESTAATADIRKPDPNQEQKRKERFLTHLEARISDVVAKQKHQFDLIVATGDVADNSDTKQPNERHAAVLQKARLYLEHLADTYCLNRRDGLFAVPGNHDYRWFGSFPSRDAKQQFRQIFAPYFAHQLLKFRALSLLVACFDSNHVRSRHELAMGSVDITELDNVRSEFASFSPEEQAAIRIALVHHHPLPVAEAESFKPSRWWETLLRRKFEGAPEFMLLRNSGTFLQRLLDAQFRLVLHGHMHQRGYWRALTSTQDDLERWIEVISCASAGKPEEGQKYSFNAVRIYRDGFLESTHYGFDEEGRFDRPYVVRSASYEAVRRDVWDLGPGSKPAVRCKVYSQTWDVNLSNCDLVTTELFRDLKSASNAEVPDIKLRTSGTGLSLSTFRAHVLHGGYNVTPRRPLPKVGQPLPAIDYYLDFKPPLQPDASVDVICNFNYKGVLFRSEEDQVLAGATEDLGWDEIAQTIHWPYEHLLIRVRFVGEGQKLPAWFPEAIMLEVRDLDGRPSRREERSENVVLDYWSPDRQKKVGSNQVPEAILSVQRPRLGYKYCLRWKLPRNDHIPNRHEIERLRNGLLRVDETPLSRQIADAFCNSAKEALQQSLDPWVQVHSEKELHAYLYGFDAATQNLVYKGTTARKSDDLCGAFQYGKDIIGTAFRRKEPVSYAGANYEEGVQLFDRLKHERLRFVFACPLNWPPPTGWPIGVVALASTAEYSVLHEPVIKREIAEKLSENLLRLWHQNCAKICGEETKGGSS